MPANANQLTPCWAYDPATGELLGEETARPDPVEGQPLVPANATLEPPPSQIPAGQVAVWDDAAGNWVLVQDYRGTVYDTATGEPEQWHQLGPLPAEKTHIAPPDDLSVWDATAGQWVPDLAKHQAAKLVQLAAEYQAALEAGVSYQGALFESDDHSQVEMAKVLTAIANGWPLPKGFVWVDANNTLHPVPDVAWLQGLAAAMADHKAALFARLQAAKAAVRSATTVIEVDQVVL